MISVTGDVREGDGSARWLALPQPAERVLEEGRWRPDGVTVEAADPVLAREAERLRAEVSALGIDGGRESRVSLRIDPRLAPEGFTIEVGADVVVEASTATGAFRATRQLLHNLRAQGFVPHGRVAGEPVVGERGLHLDAGRKHYPADWIVELLRAAADVGINTFQWHFSENEGFRLASEAFPEVVSSAHITRAEAAHILAEAEDLHIAVVPSLDMPGHLRRVLAAHPDLRLPAGIDAPDAAIVGTDHALDITRPEAVDFARRLIDDIAPVFAGCRGWHLGGDEFVDFARMDDYPALTEAAHRRFGPDGTGFDLLTAFVDEIAAHVRGLGFEPRVWNDGMLRSGAVRLDPDVVLTWWTNWNAGMRPLSDALAAGNPLVNVNDGLFYYVLGEKAGYRYPTAERIWAVDWHPGLFPVLPGGVRQEILRPYPPRLRGCSFAIWSDDPEGQTPQEVAAGIRSPLRAMAERAWNGGSALSFGAFEELDRAIGRPALSG
ncbi:family 20 glycosylhydrolase [Microbacterium sp.]|uniref:family 20 glycosylhydrolase n=1 Tax=Microbacterium sp. TaxID=51671 RepID=UPI0033423F17